MLQNNIVLHLVIAVVTGYYLQPERVENAYVNEKYVVWGEMSIRRFSRNSPYYLKLAGEIKQPWTNNVTARIILEEKLSNMYKPTFIELRFGVCDLVEKEHIIGSMIKRAGITCPVPKGIHILENMTVTMEDFPNVFPFRQGRADVQLILTTSGEILFRSYVYWSMLKDNPLKSKAKTPDKIGNKALRV